MRAKINTKQKILISIASIVVFIGLVLIAGPFVFPLKTNPEDIRYGVSYSTDYAQDLGIDPVFGYAVMADELGFDLARIPVYWNRIEPQDGEFDWDELDQLMQISSEKNIDVILAIGRRVPRWPECFIPTWVDVSSSDALESAQLDMVCSVVDRYKDSDALVRWQVENEPYFTLFGDCPKLHGDFLVSEFDLVRSLDNNTPIQTTASGEQSFWFRASRLSRDYIGVSVYRTTYSPIIGYSNYVVKPWMYRARAGLVGDATLTVSELQAEPWFARPIEQYTKEEMLDIFNVDDFYNNMRFVQRVGFEEVLFWGTEWWYYMKEAGHPEIYNASKEFFVNNGKIGS